MDCDNQRRIVKRDDHTDPLVPHIADVPGLARLRQINFYWLLDYRFGVGNGYAELASTIPGVSAEVHTGSSLQPAISLPQG